VRGSTYGLAAVASVGAVAAATGVIALIEQYVPVLSLGVLYIFAVLPVADLLALSLAPVRLSGFQSALKRAFDVIVSAVLFVLLLPVLLAVALAIKLDSRGPVLFRQTRVTKGGRSFTVLKFRTMTDGASPAAHREYIARLARGEIDDGTGLKKLSNDQRVTRVGGLLRKLSLDELPQFFNVIGGSMSLIGPRPAIEYEVEHYSPHHFERFGVRPGLTGLWQVSGRSSVGFNEMLDLDVEYARTSSPAVDLRVLIRTPVAMIRFGA